MEKITSLKFAIPKRDFTKGWPGVEVAGKTRFTLYSMRFTQEEREALQGVLVKFPDEKVSAFISDLEKLCLWELSYLKDRNVTFDRTEKKRMLRHFEKTQKELLQLVDRKVKAQENKSILEIGVVSDEMVLEHDRLYWLMLTAAMKLKEIVTVIQNESSSPGRPATDSATGDFVKIVAHGFKNFFEKPTAYGSSKDEIEDKPFFAVVQIALEACGLPSKDPSRHIKAALKSL